MMPAEGEPTTQPTSRVEGTVRDADTGVDQWTVHCEFLGAPSTVRVLMPDSVAAGQKVRTLYALPVVGGVAGTFGDGLAEL